MCKHHNHDSKADNALSRRNFLVSTAGSSLAAGAVLHGAATGAQTLKKPKQHGPAARVKPKIKAAFVRRREEYGMWWPGAVYNGNAARKKYTEELRKASKELNLQVDLRPQPIYSKAEAAAWIEAAKEEKVDAILVLLQDRQQHSWPTAYMAADSGIPTIIHTPLGTSFTTNTQHIAGKKGCVTCATDDFSEVAFALKMVKAHKKLDATRYIVIKGDKRKEQKLNKLGTTFQYVPAEDFVNEYEKTPIDSTIRSLAADYINKATGITSGSMDDVVNGLKSFSVIHNILKREKGDAITMDCLGILADKKISLPCIAWSYMLDHGVPAACEADLGACVTHALVQYLFDRPGFQQDPVAETSRGTLIGAHCTCATCLNGHGTPSEPFDLRHHHANRDAVPRPVWKVGQKITVADYIAAPAGEEERPQLTFSTGEVVENRSVPPAGGCVVSVEVKLDNVSDCLAYPGFHQLFFYGDYKRQLRSYCQLYDIEPVEV